MLSARTRRAHETFADLILGDGDAARDPDHGWHAAIS
jgi:hypothetical protein